MKCVVYNIQILIVFEWIKHKCRLNIVLVSKCHNLLPTEFYILL